MKNFEEQSERLAIVTILCCGESEYNTLNNSFENENNISLFNLKDFNEIDIEGNSNKEKVVQAVHNSDIVFVTTSLGEEEFKLVDKAIEICKSENVLTLGVGIKPDALEDAEKRKFVDSEITYYKNQVDSLILIDNEKLIDTDITLRELNKLSNKALTDTISGIVSLICLPGLVNLDICDIKVIASGNSLSYVGIGSSKGINDGKKAAKAALSSPLLCEPIQKAKGIILSITASPEVHLFEVNEIAEAVQEAANEDANIIFGFVSDDNMEGIQVVILASGYENMRNLRVVK